MREARVFVRLLHITAFFITLTAIACTESGGKMLPEVSLKVPESKEHIFYLGLKGEPGSTFKLDEIDADILIIELFSMYCPHCQKAAPAVNELYHKMEEIKRSDLKLVIIGIGASNTELEVDTFRDGFNIPFPLFPDQDLSIYHTLAGDGTPTFIGYKKDGDNSVIFFRKSGRFKDPADFMNTILDNSGLK